MRALGGQINLALSLLFIIHPHEYCMGACRDKDAYQQNTTRPVDGAGGVILVKV